MEGRGGKSLRIIDSTKWYLPKEALLYDDHDHAVEMRLYVSYLYLFPTWALNECLKSQILLEPQVVDGHSAVVES